MTDETQNTPATVPVKPQLMPVVDDGEFAQLLDSNRFAQIQRVASLFAESTLVPDVFQGKVANCAVALQMAFRMRVDPMMLMQNMYIVHGKPGIEAKLAIALINSRGPFDGPIQWRQAGEGDNRSWTAFAKHKQTGEVCEATVTWKMVAAEGWDANKKWKSLPDMMGRYRSAMFLGRLYCPEVLLGLQSAEELHDVVGGMRTVEGERLDEPMPILMPRAKADAPAEVPTETTGNGSVNRFVSDGTGERVDTETGEVHGKSNGKSNGKAATPDQMNTPASDAQRRMIRDIAKRQQIDAGALDAALTDKFGFVLDSLPIGLVNEAIQFARNLQGPAS